MAVEFKKFETEFKKIQDSMAGAHAEMKSVDDTQGNTKKLLDGTRLAIGDRVQAMKAAGSQGAVLADFAGDSQVKAALETAKKSLANFAATESRKKTAIESFKKIYKDLLDLASRMDAEIASRKKNMFEPKSLPDMIKLAKKVRDSADSSEGLKGQSIKETAATKVKDGEFEATFWAALDLEIKKSAAIRANAAASDLLEMFKPRLMKLRADRVTSLAKEIEGICVAATAAQNSGDSGGAKNTFKPAFTKCDEMHDIVEKYNLAYRSNKSFVEQNPDFKAILATVSMMASTEHRALQAVHTIQAAIK